MDFGELRQNAIEFANENLRKPLKPDEVLKHVWRVLKGKPQALEHWLYLIFPGEEPNNIRELVKKKGREAWNDKGKGADMDEKGWEALQAICKGKQPNLDKIAEHAAKNMHALLGPVTTAEIVDAAGSTLALSRFTQRDILALGNLGGTYGSRPKDSILTRHGLATNERALRVLASRTVLAARLDTYSGNFKGDSLKQEVLYAQ